MVNHENFLIPENRKVLSHSKFSFAEVESVSLSKNIINQGFVSILYNLMMDSFDNQDVDNSGGDLDDAIECTKNAYKEVGKNPTFTICYLQCPHTAFVYKENGEKNTDRKDLENWEDKNIYLGQLKYTNSFIKETVDNIISNDPNSIIVFQADHGARYSYHRMMDYKKSEYDASLETEKMQNVLNAVYVGEDMDININIEGMSCINTWRTILNEVYGTNYEMLDEPKHYIYKWRYRNASN